MATTRLYVPANICDFAPKKGDAHCAALAEDMAVCVFAVYVAPSIFDSDEPAIDVALSRALSFDLQPVFVERAPVIVVRAKVVVGHDCTLSFGDQLGI